MHNGVTPAEFEPVTLAPHATDLVFLGEFRPVKDIDTLIDAIASLHRSGTRMTATLVGEGPEMPALSAQVTAAGLVGAVRFAPPMPARVAMALGRNMIIPSRAESLPYVVLETAAAGRPLITTSVGGIPEISGPLAHLLVRPGDAQTLADTIANAVGNPQAMHDNPQILRARVASLFSADTMVDDVLAGYEQAIRRKPALRRALSSLSPAA